MTIKTVLVLVFVGAGAATVWGRQALSHGIPDLCANAPNRTVIAGGTSQTRTGTLGCVEVHGALTLTGSGLADTILVYPGGSLTLGNGSRLTFRDFPIDTQADPEQWGHGLIVIDGTVRAQGNSKTPFVRLASEPLAGATVLTLTAAPTGWAAGDRLFVPDTRQMPDTEWFNTSAVLWHETRTIAAISGSTVTLSAPLTFEHRGARDADGTPRFLPHVANLTRTIIVRSQNPLGVRGHVFFTGRSDVNVQGVAFVDLGRTKAAPLDSTVIGQHIGTNQIGRYAVHVHMLNGPVNPANAGNQFTLASNVVEASLKWGIAIHASHYGRIEGNVVYGGTNLTGAGIALEDGSETENLIQGNFVADIRGNINPRDTLPNTANGTAPGAGGDCLWGAGFNNRINDNVLVGCRNPFQQVASGAGIKLAVQPVPPTVRQPRFRGADLADAAETVAVNPQRQPILEMRGNEVYGLTATGITLWELGTNGYDTPSVPESVISDFRVWHTYDGFAWLYPSNHLTFDRLTYRVDTFASQKPAGLVAGDYRIVDLAIRNSDIHAGAVMGFVTDPLGTFTFENVQATTYDWAYNFRTPATPGTGAVRSSGLTIRIVGGRVVPWPGRVLATLRFLHTPNAARIDTANPYVVHVQNYQGNAGDAFAAYFGEQGAQHLYGGRAPCNDKTSRPEVDGITCGGSSPPPRPCASWLCRWWRRR